MLFNAIVGCFVEFNQRKEPARTKMLRVMKLTALILMIACMQVTAHGIAQERITFSGEDVPLEKVFSVIKKQTNYLFLYNDALLEGARKVSIHVKNASIEEVLNACFKDQPFNYTIKGKTIFVVNKPLPEKKEVSVINGTPPGDEIKGRITNAAGEPLSGANIVVKRTGKGTQANANGEFTLKGVSSEEMIVVTYTGYAPQTVKVGGSKNLMLVMQVADDELDEMVVQGYGTITRRLATGNISKVSAEEIERQPVMNPLLALQGRVAGLDVKQVNGFASAPIKIELRGRNVIGVDPSHTYPSDPLYIIDGVPLTINEIGGNSSYAGGSTGFFQNGYRGPAGGQSPLFSINPTDIESIEVLKDADATAIYGSRGANGIILITTKRGKAGKAKFDLHVQDGISMQTRKWDLLNTQQYIQMRKQALSNDGITPSLSHGDYDLVQWDTTRYTDWQKALYGHVGQNIDIQTSLGGGDAFNTFRIGTGYDHSTNIQTVNGADQRGMFSLALNHHSLDQRFNVSLSGQYTFSNSNMINLPGAVTLPPNAPAIYDSSGNLNYLGWGPPNSVTRRAFQFSGLQQPYTAKTNFLNCNLVVNYQPIKGLKLGASLGYNSGQANNQILNLIASYDPSTNPTGSNYSGYNNNKNWIIEPQVTYDFWIGRGKTTVLVGSSLQQTNTDGTFIIASGYKSDNMIKNFANALTKDVTNTYGEYRYAALFGRINYNWENKYLLNVTARRDGSSRFGAGKQYGNFGSIGVAWIFTEVKWLKKNISFLSFGKLRASYGTTGSDGIGDYKYLSQWSSNGAQPYNGSSSLEPILHANPNFQWQVNKKLEAAIDLSFFRDRINMSLVYYRNRCGNQLIQFPLPAMTGFVSVAANSPALVQNDGWEFTAGVRLISSKDFNFNVNFNGAIGRNKLIAYPNIEQSPYANLLVVGQSLNIIKLLHYTGVDPQTGEYTFQDKNGDGTINYNYSSKDNDFYNYNLSPKFFGGMGMNFNYKRLQLNLFFAVKKQIGRNAFSANNPAGTLALGNIPKEIIGKQWQKPGDVSTYASFTTKTRTSDQQFFVSDGTYTDASFIRLSNLSLSYNLPVKQIKKIGVQTCNIFFNTNNLFLITKYKGLDPETQNFGGMPPAKIIVGGININF